jgi:high-affinity nickel-transport protein
MLSGSLAPILLGALLGLRHATDADHLVAVTAIVSRERSLVRAARVGE